MSISVGKTIAITSGTSWRPPADAIGVPLRVTVLGAGTSGGNSAGFPDPGPNGTGGSIGIRYRYVIQRSPVPIFIPATDQGDAWFVSSTTINSNGTGINSTDFTSAGATFNYQDPNGLRWDISQYGYGGAGEDTVNGIPAQPGGQGIIFVTYLPSRRRIGIV